MFLALISTANANNGVNSRLFTANTNNSAGNANTNIGAHLMRYYYKNMHPCHLAKDNKSTKNCVGSSGEDSVCALQLEQVAKEDFPFSGTIVNIDNLYQFQ